MEKEFVTYEIALKLKQVGFSEPCFGFYNSECEFYYGFSSKKGYSYSNFTNKGKSKVILAPLWQQVWSFLDDNEVIIGIIFVDNVFKYTLNTDNYVSNGFTNRMSAIKSATKHATNYLWDKKFNK